MVLQVVMPPQPEKVLQVVMVLQPEMLPPLEKLVQLEIPQQQEKQEHQGKLPHKQPQLVMVQVKDKQLPQLLQIMEKQSQQHLEKMALPLLLPMMVQLQQ